ncbi:uncharacterized protein A1O5_04899 [Cladophialophora psammophila CBS 110553]|uniref:Major facilitator superfamily (MFS) profile domain-containing protein n=1 Tax=Cladophialophora psammophila CBS 110553 TaxID=1182543 RepID=W9X525_9EURO|nr:uncharacterized protein A1O5_04899 [Cladophialophora psammophila CBS 110553]EXJ72395.1 hypothetical protein A1O5_04899 [Cladophialophora psammophila CBS 110553]
MTQYDVKETITSSEGTNHEEFADLTNQVLHTDLAYDKEGIGGILRSPFVFGAALLASFGGFSFGYDQGVISLILVMPQFHEQFPKIAPDAPRYGFNVGVMTGLLELGAFIGCLCLPYLADHLSRKWGLTVATCFFCIGAVIQTASHNYNTLVAGRFIGGIGVGTLAMSAPLYISEIAPPNIRGSLLVLEAISIVIGAIIAYWITYATRHITGDGSFRLPFLLGRNGDSLKALAKLRRLPQDDSRVQTEWKGILVDVRFQEGMLKREHPNTDPLMLEIKQWIQLFKPKYIRQTLVAIGIPFFQQFSGINAFVYYAPTFFAALGQSYEMTLILSGMVNICQLVAGIPTFLFLDQIGRRKLAIFGGLAMAVPHIIMAGVVGKFSHSWPTHQGVGWFGVALIYTYVLTYAASYGPLAWTLPAECFSTATRSKGVGIATATIWIANFIIGVAIPQMAISIGWGTYLFFGCFCLGASVFSFFLVPETSKKSLEQIAEVFGDKSIYEEAELMARVAEELFGRTTSIEELKV